MATPMTRVSFYHQHCGWNHYTTLRVAGSHGLTCAEYAVALLTMLGLSNKQMANRLGVSIKTIEKHRQSIHVKWGVHESLGFAAKMLRLGLVSAEWWTTAIELEQPWATWPAY